jgi:hypothetical protein
LTAHQQPSEVRSLCEALVTSLGRVYSEEANSPDTGVERRTKSDSRTYEKVGNTDAHYSECLGEHSLIWLVSVPNGQAEQYFVNYRLLDEINNHYLVSDSSFKLPGGIASASGGEVGDFLLLSTYENGSWNGYSIYQVN